VLEEAERASRRPWVVFASSREVYGQPEVLPATEDSPLRPVNIYGRSKVEGERLVDEAHGKGLRACTIRLSNVFGSPADHADRVIPAFARGALSGGELRVEGRTHTFDFTFVDDVVRGIASLLDVLSAGAMPPAPIHFVSGRPTTLGDLAALTIRVAGSKATIAHAPRQDVRRGSLLRRRHPRATAPRLAATRTPARRARAPAPRPSRRTRLEPLVRSNEGSAMKILKVIHGYPMRYNAGSEVYSQTLCHGLAERHEVHVFTREEDAFARDFRLRTEHDEDDPRITVHVVNNPRYKDRYRASGVDERFAEVLERVRPDVVHVGHLNHLSTSLLREAAVREVPIVFTLHDYWLMCPRGQFMQMFPEDPTFSGLPATGRRTESAPSAATHATSAARRKSTRPTWPTGPIGSVGA
jgi:hypothetical protein